jgi:hypothetical protein
MRTLLALAHFSAALALSGAEVPAEWRPLFNGRDLSNWDTWLGPRPEASGDSSKGSLPIGLNTDPLGVFSVVSIDGAPAIRISGQVFGALTTREEYGNVHIRAEYKWGEKKWPPRHEAGHYRDSGILYWCVGQHGAGSGAWMRSVECNIMERGVGQWWSVAGAYCNVEGRRVTLEQEPNIPYRGESPGEQVILWQPGGPTVVAGVSEGVTSPLDPEHPHGQWNVCEVMAWGNAALHLLNGRVVLALTNPRYAQGGRETPLRRGKVQIQSEGAEVFYRKIEVRVLAQVPVELWGHVPGGKDDEAGFQPLFGKTAGEGWKQCGPGHFTLANGVATGVGGMGLWWHTNRMFTNFVLRGEWVQEGDIADSGLFLRFPDPGNDPWVAVHKGHEMEIGDPAPQDPTWRTGSIYPFAAAVTTACVKPYGEWNRYEIICDGHNYSVRINGQLVTMWTDPQQRSQAGYIGLQNYDDGKTVRHRNLRIRELP